MDTARARAEAALRRDATLEALAFAAQRFLEEPSWQASIDQVLRRLGEAVDVSRAYVYENRDHAGAMRTLVRARWLAAGVGSRVEIGAELDYEGFERWVTMLSRGDLVAGAAASFPVTERDALWAHDIRSVLVVPISVEGAWWGYLGFDECVREREWTQLEIDALRAMSGTLASAIIRERSDRQLREAEERFRRIVETTPAITYQEDLTKEYTDKGSVLYVSPQIERILGYTPADWAGIPGFWTQIMHPDDREAVVREAELTGRTGDHYRQEYRMIAADGRVVWFSDEAVQIRDEHGHPAIWQGVMLDITERKEAEARLREAEEIFRALVEHLPAVAYREALVASPEDFYISPRVEEVFGYTPDEWTWTPGFWVDRIHPEDRERVLALDEGSNRTQHPFTVDYRFRHADGTYRWVHEEATLVERRGGEGFWQGFLLDITERKGAESAMAEAEERYRLLVERSPLVIYVQEIDPISAASVTTYLSPANEALVGYSREEVAADPTLWTRLIHPDDRERVMSKDRQTNTTGEDFTLEYRMLHRDGRIVWVRDVATLVEVGDRTYWQGFMLDITERKDAEVKLARALEVEREATQRLRGLDEMKNTFLQAVSHDLRTPLAAILGLAVTLERSEIELEAEEVHDLARRIATNARKLDRLVTDLLDLDRLARGIVEPKLQPTDVSAIVDRVVAESDLLAAGRVRVDIAPVIVSVDAAKVERIVENLLANAARYTPDDALVWVAVEPAEGGVLIRVDDEGPGIPADMHQAVFEPFRQGPTSPEHAPGVGIGLALVSRFAEVMGGRAWVQDRPGGGASFRVYLADGPITAAEVGTAG